MVALRERMRDLYAGWQADLPEEPFGPDRQPVPGWRTLFEGCRPPDFEAIPWHLEIAENASVWPGRRANPHEDAPEGAHICRAFEGMEPEGVRVVVLGQDPYPSISSATGRAFEDGTPDEEDRAIRRALCALGQSALDLDPGAEHRAFCHGRVGRAEAIRICFDRLADDGVLFANAAWTFTKKSTPNEQQKDYQAAHRALWKPVTEHLFREIAMREQESVVFLLFGRDAKRIFADLDLPPRNTVRVVEHTHPTAPNNSYFKEENPFEQVNQELRDLGQAPITWWVAPNNAGAA